jgi:2-succinyl-5-enolpyruvyl-6-hydroxy-3-cyclohexene-1-carboxylate synthase
VSVQATFAATLVDEWAFGGVTDAVICPGSRSTPLALALADRLQVHVRLDERSAAFYAIGIALASGRPTVICTTSGTATAELHAAIVEAHHACVPLIVCTADRPPELHHVGASQTIDQVGLFTSSTRWACDPGVPDAAHAGTWRPLAARALAEAVEGPRGPGPVHLNLPFREPLVGGPDALPVRHGPMVVPRPRSTPMITPSLSGRGLLIAGARACRHPHNLLALGQTLGWPVLADPRSGCRVEGTIAAADAIVRADIDRPDTVVLLGAPWVSKALAEYVAAAAADGARVAAVDPWWQWVDPSHVVSEIHRSDPDDWIRSAQAVAVAGGDPEWLARWNDYEAAAQSAINTTLGTALSEPLVARMLSRHAAAHGAAIMASASMPMRDLEWFAPALPSPPRVMANRGVNGIDGVVSTALGMAAAGWRTFALLGDLAFLHDVSGLVNLADLPCTFVVLDNGGGGIFSFLPQAEVLEAERFELLFGTPPTSDVDHVAQGFGLRVADVSTISELEDALQHPPPVMIRVRVPGRAENAALHDAVNQAVRLAVG